MEYSKMTNPQLIQALKEQGVTEDLSQLVKKDLLAKLEALAPEAGDGLENLSPEELLTQLREAKNLATGQQAVVDDLKSQVDAKKDVEAPVTVKSGGKTYNFASKKFAVPVFGQNSGGKVYTAKEASEDKDLIKLLLEKKSGVLVEVK